MSKKYTISEEDKTLFRDAMRGVDLIVKVDKVEPAPPRLPIKKKMITEDSILAPLSDHENLAPLTGQSLVEFKRPGIQHKVLRKLRLGQYNVGAVLDLHGMTVVEAKEALYRFILLCEKKGVCCLLIIHGKGRTNGNPILKNKLNHWLRQIEPVLAFCSATIRDGHGGAMYALLKSQKGEKIS
jgi:DNA-nicking Smr family endonuclease